MYHELTMFFFTAFIIITNITFSIIIYHIIYVLFIYCFYLFI